MHERDIFYIKFSKIKTIFKKPNPAFEFNISSVINV